ncbi:hypothetical protein HanPI659440_Chr00c08g0720171 [Helianthus annuus]|nr:hypothetical protein HanPI659440_Chr00c08g0720171 [Helianthus annuus]
MASSADPWMRESSFGAGSEAQRHSSAIQRKITILGTRLDSLQALLIKLPTKQPLTEKETQMASVLNMSSFGNRDNLFGPDTKPADDSRV